jgi:hypothetical protein
MMRTVPDWQLQSFPGRIVKETKDELVFQEFKDYQIKLKRSDITEITVDAPGGYATITMPWFMAQKRGLL